MLRPLKKIEPPVLRRGGAGLAVLTLLLFALLLAPPAWAAGPAAAGQGWHPLTVVPGGAVNGVAFADSLRGWAVNANIFATTDGGATWNAQTSGAWSLQDVASTTSGGNVQAFTVGQDTASQRAIIVASAAGSAWVQRAAFTGGPLNAIDFGDYATGYAVGGNGAIVATTDGGGKWAVQRTPVAWDLQDVVATSSPAVFLQSFVVPASVFAVGRDPQTLRGVVVARSASGGWAERAAFAGGALNAVTFVDQTRGWAVGANGVIVSTLDGGSTWTMQESGGFWNLRGVTFADAGHGWAVGAGVILATADGGGSWTVQSATPAWDLRDVAFTDASHGVAVGLDSGTGRGVIVSTSNGGVPAPAAPTITGFAPASGSPGTAVTITGTGFTGATAVTFNGTSATFTVAGDSEISATVPAGATKGPIAVTTPGGTATSAEDFSITSVPLPVPTVTSFLPASGPVGTVVTITGAGFWQGATVTFNRTPATSVTVDSVTQITTAVPAGATSGPIAVTTAGGTGTSAASFTVTPSGAGGWAAQPSGTTATLRAVASTDATHGWAVGDGGTIVTTWDGGQAWSLQKTGSSAELRDVVFLRSGAQSAARGAGITVTVNGWAVGEGGTILVTTNGGGTWDSRNSGTSADLNAAAFPDSLHGWSVGGSGTIIVTTNGGATWSSQSSAGRETLNDVSFSDTRHGWAVGEGGEIRTTSDAGATWSQQVSGIGTALTSVAFPNSLHGWVVGEKGTILVTVNGGATWRRQVSGTTADLRGVTFVGESRGWVVGANGTILVTTNGGASWIAQRSTAAALLLGAFFPDALHGWVVGANGTILFTATGGWLPAPRIATLKPASGRRGATVTVNGFNFGATQGLSYVRFGAKKCTGYLSWSPTGIKCRVPAKAKYGKVKVTVTTPLGRSNATTFRVKR